MGNEITPELGRRGWRPLAALLALLGAVTLAHGGAVRNGFVGIDDPEYVVSNQMVKAGLTAEGVRWAFAFEGRKSYFHPITWLSLMVDAEIMGLEPWGFHLTNVLLHALNAALLLLLLLRTTSRPWPALAAALLWAVHPLTVEAVAWVTERKAVLSTAFALGAACVHVSHARRPSSWKPVVIAALLLCGSLAKPTVVVMPALLLCLDLWPLGRFRSWRSGAGGVARAPSARRLVLEKALASALTLGVVAVAMASLESAYGHGSTVHVSVARRLAIGVGAIPHYVGAALWPTGLGILHPYPGTPPWGRIALGAGILVGATALASTVVRRWPIALAGWAWFLTALAPFLGLYQAGLWPEWGERFAYLPLMGLAVVAAYGAADLAKRVPAGRFVFGGFVFAAAASLIVATRVQVRYWKDSFSLFEHGLEAEPRAAYLRVGHGNALLEAGRLAEAEATYRAGIATDPGLALIHGALGRLLMREGRAAEAEPHLVEAIRIHPDMPEFLYNYAELLRSTGRLDEARLYYARFAEIAPARYVSERRAALRHAGRSP